MESWGQDVIKHKPTGRREKGATEVCPVSSNNMGGEKIGR